MTVLSVGLRQPVAVPASPRRGFALSAKTLGVLAVIGLVVAFSLSSTLVKRADSPGVLVAFWRMVTVSVVWNSLLWSTGRHITMENVRQVFVPGIYLLGMPWQHTRGSALLGWVKDDAQHIADRISRLAQRDHPVAARS